jgi:hypothetical protein
MKKGRLLSETPLEPLAAVLSYFEGVGFVFGRGLKSAGI